MNNIEQFKSISLPSMKFDEIRRFINDESNDSLVLIESGGNKMISIPLKRKSSDNASNIVINWMNDIIAIANDGSKTYAEQVDAIKTYCNAVITTVKS